MGYPEPSINDCGAPWNEDYDETTGELFCGCARCKAARKKAARDEWEGDRDND